MRAGVSGRGERERRTSTREEMLQNGKGVARKSENERAKEQARGDLDAEGRGKGWGDSIQPAEALTQRGKLLPKENH